MVELNTSKSGGFVGCGAHESAAVSFIDELKTSLSGGHASDSAKLAIVTSSHLTA